MVRFIGEETSSERGGDFFPKTRSKWENLLLSFFWTHLEFCEILVLQPGESEGTPLQYSCLGNPMDGRAWWAAVHGVAKSRTRLSDFTFPFRFHALEKEMATHMTEVT